MVVKKVFSGKFERLGIEVYKWMERINSFMVKVWLLFYINFNKGICVV